MLGVVRTIIKKSTFESRYERAQELLEQMEFPTLGQEA